MKELKIEDVAFVQGSANVEQLEEIIQLLHKRGKMYWQNAQNFLDEGFDHSWGFLTKESTYFDLDGNIPGASTEHQLVMFDRWYEMAKQALTQEDEEETLQNVGFVTSEVTKEQIQTLLDIAARHGNFYWENADKFLSYIGADTHVTFFNAKSGIDGRDIGLYEDIHIEVTFERFLEMFKEHYGEVIKNLDEMPVRNPRPRYRQRKRQKPQVAKTIVRVLYVTQQTYTLKNVRSVQIIDDKVFIQYQREITEGIIENAEVEIDGKLVMAVVIHEVGNRSNFFRNIDGSWDFQADNGTVINNGKQLGRIFKQ